MGTQQHGGIQRQPLLLRRGDRITSAKQFSTIFSPERKATCANGSVISLGASSSEFTGSDVTGRAFAWKKRSSDTGQSGNVNVCTLSSPALTFTVFFLFVFFAEGWTKYVVSKRTLPKSSYGLCAVQLVTSSLNYATRRLCRT